MNEGDIVTFHSIQDPRYGKMLRIIGTKKYETEPETLVTAYFIYKPKDVVIVPESQLILWSEYI